MMTPLLTSIIPVTRQTNLPLLDDDTCADIYLEGAGFVTQDTMQCAGTVFLELNKYFP